MPPSIARAARCTRISIHALLAESDQRPYVKDCKTGKFLSTLSLRRATWALWPQRARLRNFYPRSPCGERPADCAVLVHLYDFYPRSPCGERRVISSCSHTSTYFYPRSPCGERLIHFVPQPPLHAISIHALLAESDCGRHDRPRGLRYFYPRSPCGERPPPAQRRFP